MSKLAKKPIELPTAVSASVSNGVITISNKKNEKTTLKIPESFVSVSIDGSKLTVTKVNESKESSSCAGTIYRTIVTMVKGLSADNGHTINIDLKGVGYKAVVSGKYVTFTLGYSHSVVVEIWEGIKVTVEKNTKVSISGFDKVKLMDFVRFIQKSRKKNPYKGTGIHAEGEYVRKKEVKKSKK